MVSHIFAKIVMVYLALEIFHLSDAQSYYPSNQRNRYLKKDNNYPQDGGEITNDNGFGWGSSLGAYHSRRRQLKNNSIARRVRNPFILYHKN